MRFRSIEKKIPDEMKAMLYYIPVSIKFMKKSEKESFNKKIFHHVRNYKANKRLSEK
jgi:hypothetical protein